MAINLPELSAKICGLHGTHRSQYVAAATTEVIAPPKNTYTCHEAVLSNYPA